MDDLDGFIAQWDDPAHPGNAEVFDLKHSEFGNINDNGQPGLYRSPELTPHHAQFRTAIEPGVRDLVVALVEQHRWITYCSCAGHLYPDTGVEPAERHVGIVPRDAAERDRVVGVLSGVIAATVAATPSCDAVRLGLANDVIGDGTTRRDTVELWFARAAGTDWSRYFSQLETVYGELLTALART
jgi:uncharacterized protein